MEPKAVDIKLPVMAVGRTDVARLLREVESVDEFMNQSAIRQPGTSVKMPKTSRLLDEMVADNKLNLLVGDDRTKLRTFLRDVHDKAPILHMSFSADPSPAFTQKLIIWLRQNLHPKLLLQVGLQPNIGAGCVVRTSNRYFDLSMKQKFHDQRDLLISRLQGASK